MRKNPAASWRNIGTLCVPLFLANDVRNVFLANDVRNVFLANDVRNVFLANDVRNVFLASCKSIVQIVPLDEPHFRGSPKCAKLSIALPRIFVPTMVLTHRLHIPPPNMILVSPTLNCRNSSIYPRGDVMQRWRISLTPMELYITLDPT